MTTVCLDLAHIHWHLVRITFIIQIIHSQIRTSSRRLCAHCRPMDTRRNFHAFSQNCQHLALAPSCTVRTAARKWADFLTSFGCRPIAAKNKNWFADRCTKNENRRIELTINPLTPNDPYRARTAPLTSKVAFYIFIQQIKVLNILHMVYTLRFFLQNAVCFIILTYLVLVLFTFYIQSVIKFKKNIYSTNIGTEYFKHGIYSPFFLQNADCFIILTYFVPVLYTFYIQDVIKLKKYLFNKYRYWIF